MAWDALLACAASPFTSAHLRSLRELAGSELDWHAVLNLTKSHGLLALVHERLSEISDAVPDDIRRAVSREFEQNARQTLWLAQLLFNVSDLFQRHGIEAMPYKGPILAQQLYGNVTLRQYSDIDILIRSADVPRASLVLQEAGFTAALELSAREERDYIAAGYEYTFHGLKNPNVLEVQWRILPRFHAVDFEVAECFRRAQKIFIGERPVATLSNEDLLLVLCVHAAKHAWSKLSWIRDVAELSQMRNVDWGQVIREAGRLGLRRIVAMTFQIANQMLRTPLPPAIQPLMEADGAVCWIAQQTCQQIRTGDEMEVESLAYFRFMTQLRERPIDRLRFWFRLATTPSVSEWSLVRLPDVFSPLYHGVRAVRLGSRLFRGRRFRPRTSL
jgi:hypothetical protein